MYVNMSMHLSTFATTIKCYTSLLNEDKLLLLQTLDGHSLLSCQQFEKINPISGVSGVSGYY